MQMERKEDVRIETRRCVEVKPGVWANKVQGRERLWPA